MSLIHRCDNCKKIIFKEDDRWEFGTDYTLGGSSIEKPIKVNSQVIVASVRFYLECGNSGDFCDKCAKLLIRKLI